MNGGKGLREWIRVGGEGAVEFSEFGFGNFKGCRNVEVIVCRLVGDIPGSVVDGKKELWIGNSGCVVCWLAWLNSVTQCHKSIVY